MDAYGEEIIKELKRKEHRILRTAQEVIKFYMVQSNRSFQCLIEEHKHDLYHYYHFTTRCELCSFDYLLPDRRLLQQNHLELLCIPSSLSNFDTRNFNCSITVDEIDLDIAWCLLDCCDDIFWRQCLQLQRKTFGEFLNENKHEIYHLVGGLNRCNQCKNNSQQHKNIITQKQWTYLFYQPNSTTVKSANLSKETVTCASKVMARTDITINQLYEDDIKLAKHLLLHLMPLKKGLVRLLALGQQLLNSDTTSVSAYRQLCLKFDQIMGVLVHSLPNNTADKDHAVSRKQGYNKNNLLNGGILPEDEFKFYEYRQTKEKDKIRKSETYFIDRDRNAWTSDFSDKQTKKHLPSRYFLYDVPFEQCFLPGGTIFKTPQERLASYTYWPVHPMFWPYPLALAGFFYTGTEHLVRCFTCDYTASVNSWIPPENPSEAHARCSPDCSFVQGNGFKICAKIDTSSENAVLEKDIKGNPFISCVDFSTKQCYSNDKSSLLKGESATIHTTLFADNVFCPPDTYANTDNISLMYPNMINGIRKTSTEINDIGCDGMNEMVSSLSIQTSDAMVVENQVANLEEAKVEQHSKFLFTDTADTTLFFDDTAKKNNQVLEDNVSNLNVMTTESNLHSNDNSLIYKFTDGSVAKLKYPQFQLVKSRLQTYTNWKYSSKQQPILLAEAGYFYTGEADIVRCFCCDLGLAEWDAQDDPWVEHARHNSRCLFLKREKGEDYVNDVQLRWKKIYNPKHPILEDRDSRLKTFAGVWRTDIEQTPDILVDAGFFYTGEEDTVRCHYCDGGLRNWEPKDIPWEEHARWFPFCKFVIKMKGREYIDEIRIKHESTERNEEVATRSDELFVNHPFVQQLQELEFKTEDITAAMQVFKSKEGRSNFTIEDIVEIIIQGKGREQEIQKSIQGLFVIIRC
ncbi:baculoviral IAP repeat-containing protein 7/8 [Mytilus galloprovincialis]|uniref:Baculoviral IAP repeat-containing protein 7/8 n=1 Tax=Mytilus galloprovincialis TaxID=29158 RepID=A0A8B6E1J2_MYTGA|nr:baculoviral IAP repeat-containing protein 7/8 [Mytilus galloprovincialis]